MRKWGKIFTKQICLSFSFPGWVRIVYRMQKSLYLKAFLHAYVLVKTFWQHLFDHYWFFDLLFWYKIGNFYSKKCLYLQIFHKKTRESYQVACFCLILSNNKLNLMESKNKVDYTYTLSIDIYKSIVSHITNFDTILRIEEYLKNKSIWLVCSLKYFKEQIDSLITLYFEQKQCEDMNVIKSNTDLCVKFNELFDNEYFDNSYTSELEVYIRSKIPYFQIDFYK